jgi:hypothetical protein
MIVIVRVAKGAVSGTPADNATAAEAAVPIVRGVTGGLIVAAGSPDLRCPMR